MSLIQIWKKARGLQLYSTLQSTSRCLEHTFQFFQLSESSNKAVDFLAWQWDPVVSCTWNDLSMNSHKNTKKVTNTRSLLWMQYSCCIKFTCLVGIFSYIPALSFAPTALPPITSKKGRCRNKWKYGFLIQSLSGTFEETLHDSGQWDPVM